MPPATTHRNAWETFADTLLEAAVLAATGRDRAADPLAGLRLADEDVAALLADLDRPAPDATATVEAARERLQAARPDDALAAVARHARLDQLETEVLAVLTAVEQDPRRARLVSFLNDDITARHPTANALRALFSGDPQVLPVVGPGGGLARAGLLEPVGGDPSWGEAPLRLSPPVLWWLAGDRSPDPGLPAGASVVPGGGSGRHDLVVVASADRVRRVQAAAAALAAPALLLTPLPERAEAWDAVVRHATVAGLGVVLEVGARLPATARQRIERADHLAWAITSELELPVADLPHRRWVGVSAAPAAATDEETAAVLGDQTLPGVRLTASQLDAVSRALPALGDVGAAVRRLAAGRIEALADRITPTRGWDDLVLPAPQLEQVRHVVVRARHRGLVYGEWGFDPRPSTGVVAMFSGPSGTGKTLAAEILAGDLGLDLYRIDVSRLVDKFIGETEKHLAEAFAAAEASPVVLFFDEADAIMGKRSEVSDAHDRYANIEVAYLLQRIERFEGVVILASNLPQNLDPAFLRRIHVSVEFPMPGPAERRAIWSRAIPPGAPVADLDLDLLAERFEISGGSIHNAALTAAFLAAEAGTPLTMEAATAAVRRELQKQARLIRAEDFASSG